MDESADFGVSWVAHCVQQPKVIDEAIKLSNETFVKDKRIVDVEIDLCAKLVVEPSVISEAGQLVQRTSLGKNTYDIMIYQLAVGGYESFFKQELLKFYEN